MHAAAGHVGRLRGAHSNHFGTERDSSDACVVSLNLGYRPSTSFTTGLQQIIRHMPFLHGVERMAGSIERAASATAVRHDPFPVPQAPALQAMPSRGLPIAQPAIGLVGSLVVAAARFCQNGRGAVASLAQPLSQETCAAAASRHFAFSPFARLLPLLAAAALAARFQPWQQLPLGAEGTASSPWLKRSQWLLDRGPAAPPPFSRGTLDLGSAAVTTTFSRKLLDESAAVYEQAHATRRAARKEAAAVTKAAEAEAASLLSQARADTAALFADARERGEALTTAVDCT